MSKKTKIKLGALSENEKRLIFAIRNKYRFSDLLIKTKDGQPYLLKRTETFTSLVPGQADIEDLQE